MYRKITSGTKKVMIYKYLNNFFVYTTQYFNRFIYNS